MLEVYYHCMIQSTRCTIQSIEGPARRSKPLEMLFDLGNPLFRAGKRALADTPHLARGCHHVRKRLDGYHTGKSFALRELPGEVVP